MNTILFISNNCLHCNNLKKYEIYNKLKKCNIDNSNVRCKLPRFIKSVPTLMIKNNDDIILYMENELINWFNENSNNTSNNKSNNIQNNSNDNSNDKSNNVEQEPGSSNELWGGFSSEYSFMNDDENNNISESFYSNLNTNFNINTPSDNNYKYNDNNNDNNNNNNNNKKGVSDKYEQLIQERDKEFKPVARLG